MMDDDLDLFNQDLDLIEFVLGNGMPLNLWRLPSEYYVLKKAIEREEDEYWS